MDNSVRAKHSASELLLRTDFLLHSQDSDSLLLTSEPDGLLCIPIPVCAFTDSNTQLLHFHTPVLPPCTCFEPCLTRPPLPMLHLSQTCHVLHSSTEKWPCQDSVEFSVILSQLLVPAIPWSRETWPCSSRRAKRHGSSKWKANSREKTSMKSSRVPGLGQDKFHQS